MHNIPERPWSLVATDFFHWNGTDYVIVTIIMPQTQSLWTNSSDWVKPHCQWFKLSRLIINEYILLKLNI